MNWEDPKHDDLVMVIIASFIVFVPPVAVAVFYFLARH